MKPNNFTWVLKYYVLAIYDYGATERISTQKTVMYSAYVRVELVDCILQVLP